MNRESVIELSSSSSHESLAEAEKQQKQQNQKKEQQQQQQREIDWKKKANSTTSEDEEIEISGSKAEDDVGIDGVEEEEEEGIEGATTAAATAMSRTDSVVRDVRRLKSATLDRMGKMLKIHSKSSSEKPEIAIASVSNEEQPTRKQKFNSLTRMLRFSDKEDKSKNLDQYRGRSLTRILRRKVPVEGDNPPDKPDEHVRGIFARILQQIRGRSTKAANTATENSLQKNKEKSNLSPKLPSSSALSELNLETPCEAVDARHQT